MLLSAQCSHTQTLQDLLLLRHLCCGIQMMLLLLFTTRVGDSGETLRGLCGGDVVSNPSSVFRGDKQGLPHSKISALIHY